MQDFNLTFIIATKDREEKLFNLLRSLEKQQINNFEVIIVDAGQKNLKSDLSQFNGFKINYLRTKKPSLTNQRNIGIDKLDNDTELVGFLDDDTELEDGALKNMLDFWSKASMEIGGACFNIVTDKKSRFYWIKRIFATGCRKMGVMLPSGFVSKICPVEEDLYSQWLLGGVTIWRREIFDEFRFDEWFKGYGLYEDLEFSYRVGKKYKLVVVSKAKIRHLQEDISKKNNLEFGKAEILGHYIIVRKNPELSKILFFWACAGQFLENIYSAIFKQRLEYLKRALGNILGILEIKKTKYDNDKKIVLVVGFKYPPYGGMETITELIINSKYLNKKFKLVNLILRTRKQSYMRGKFDIWNIALTIINFVKFVYLIFKHNPDLIYSHLAQNRYGFLRDSLFILCSDFFGIKNCIHFHGEAFRRFYITQPKIIKLYIRFILKKIDKLIVLGKNLKKQFHNLVNDKKIIHIYNAVKIKNNFIFCRKNKDEENLKVTFIGYISKAKGAVDVVKAAALVAHHTENRIIFELYGPIIDRERNIAFLTKPDNASHRIKEIIEKEGLRHKITLGPVLNPDSKIQVLENSDIFVFPSYSEGCGIVVLEAMAAGLPIIMSRVGALPEILKESINCFFINPGDYKNLAEKILLLSRNANLRNEMGKNNKKLIATFFNSERFEKDIENAWRQM
jgi:glycosyltransferase involved in cell wall biosynthesis/GT2 family glycosyltransferase